MLNILCLYYHLKLKLRLSKDYGFVMYLDVVRPPKAGFESFLELERQLKEQLIKISSSIASAFPF